MSKVVVKHNIEFEDETVRKEFETLEEALGYLNSEDVMLLSGEEMLECCEVLVDGEPVELFTKEVLYVDLD